ncbi:U6 snRNA-associated Sm-like protein LSm2 [Teleopsis dalmanni]|uniref:U6 snRNA-associated Sm-like protein LSm2 n=1 Tax=Teleopsis dalmanni TaxID=139649 RepID=UPI0018CC8451|nr:U6 snRNA-associated Sm-like protein LSm2 [Teleopsis dalmanni]
MESKADKFLISNTLSSVPYLLTGCAVLIELRNEISVAGRIESADGQMNISLTDVVLIDRDGLQYSFDNYHVRNQSIRYIDIPESIDMPETLRDWVAEGGLNKLKPKMEKKKRTFKQKRAEERHKEILAEMGQKKLDKEKAAMLTNI